MPATLLWKTTQKFYKKKIIKKFSDLDVSDTLSRLGLEKKVSIPSLIQSMLIVELANVQ